jgi:cysteinyl-tRNA synthetase
MREGWGAKVAGVLKWLLELLRSAIGFAVPVLLGVVKAGYAVLIWLLPVLRQAGADLLGRWSGAGRSFRRKALLTLAAVAIALFAWSWRHVPGHWIDASLLGNRPLYKAKSWYYYLSDIDVERLARSDADVLVIDFAKAGGTVPFTREEIARLKKKPNGETRLVISYISIGEAESYRFYWRSDWTGDEMPGWHVAENCAWPRNHMVRFWHDGWKDIIYRGKRSYVARIVEAGFDGVYLDRIDVWGELLGERPTAQADMKAFVAELARTGRTLKPGFIVIAQNAEDLLQDRAYRNVIDGLGKEDLLHGHSGTGKRNSSRSISENLGYIRKLQWDYKPVLAVEYLTTHEAIEQTRKELLQYGMVPTFAHRQLDGLEPTEPPTKPREQYGTPEWIATHCKDKRHW